MIGIVVTYILALEWLGSGTKCVIKNVSGIPCPSCGMTRSYLHVLHGEFPEAFYDHPLFFTVPIILVIAYMLSINQHNQQTTKVLTVIMFIIITMFIVLYVYRMILYFPHTDPLKFYDRGLIPTIIRRFGLVFD